MARKNITAHASFDADDYAYLTAKDWSDAEIIARWTEEQAAGRGPCRWQTDTARTKLAAALR